MEAMEPEKETKNHTGVVRARRSFASRLGAGLSAALLGKKTIASAKEIVKKKPKQGVRGKKANLKKKKNKKKESLLSEIIKAILPQPSGAKLKTEEKKVAVKATIKASFTKDGHIDIIDSFRSAMVTPKNSKKRPFLKAMQKDREAQTVVATKVKKRKMTR